MAQTKSDLVRVLERFINKEQDAGYPWTDISYFMVGQNMMTDKDIVRITLEELSKRKLLIPLILKTFEEEIIGWKYIDTISEAYQGEIAPQVLSQLRKSDLEKIIEYYQEEME